MTNIDVFSIDLHAMPCTNCCRHCWTNGHPKHRPVPVEQVFFVLEKLAQVRKHIPQGAFFFYDEPTAHPQFVEIMEKACELGLMWEGFFLPTNGSVLARASDEIWQRLERAGVNCLQMTTYGLGQTHDSFAGRRGAFQDMITTIRRAMAHGIEWYAGVVLHAENVHELQETVSYFRDLDPSGKSQVGWYPFSWQGRGRNASRVRAREYAQLTAGAKQPRASFVQEKEAIDKIVTDPKLSNRRASDQICYGLGFQVDRDLKVYCGGACDGAGVIAAAPELADAFLLGVLDDDGFLPLLDTYQQNPPQSIRLLDEITWGELAERYGDRTNDEIYWLNDLPLHKWAAAYLVEALG